MEKGLPAGERALLPTFAEADSQPQGHKGQHQVKPGRPVGEVLHPPSSDEEPTLGADGPSMGVISLVLSQASSSTHPSAVKFIPSPQLHPGMMASQVGCTPHCQCSQEFHPTSLGILAELRLNLLFRCDFTASSPPSSEASSPPSSEASSPPSSEASSPPSAGSSPPSSLEASSPEPQASSSTHPSEVKFIPSPQLHPGMMASQVGCTPHCQ